MYTLYNVPIISNPHLLEVVERTWKERLFNFSPWEPWVTTKMIPDLNVYRTKQGFVMHPETLTRLVNLGIVEPVPNFSLLGYHTIRDSRGVFNNDNFTV